MITVITDKQEIIKLHKKFHEKLDIFMTSYVDCMVGYPSGSFKDRVKYSRELNIWLSHGEHENKFWNGFGVGEPIEGRNNSLIGEINFPKEGNYRRIAGAFGIEDNGNILVLHRGKIGGGKPGIGKNYFTDNFRGDFVKAIDGNKETNFCLVGELNSNHFPRQVSIFINEIFRVKKLEEGEKSLDFGYLNDFNYTKEHFGNSVTELNEPLVIDRTHGIVVNALANELILKKFKIGNDRNPDLFIYNNSQITFLFEVKTSSSTQFLYSAVGQLLIYSIPIKNQVRLVAVLPEKLSRSVTNRLATLGIEVLYFHWNEDKPKFIDIDNLLEIKISN